MPTIRTVWIEHRTVLVSTYLYLMAVWSALMWHGLASARPPAAQFREGLVGLVAVTGGALFVRAAADRKGLAWLSSSKVAGALLVALLAPAVIGIYGAWKQALAVTAAYTWDPAFHRLSLALYGAPDWTYFEALYHHPSLMWALDRFYFVGWGLATTATLLAMAWTERRVLRLQALLATVWTWALLGSLGAALLASGGPAFYHLFVNGPDPYAPLHAALARTPDLLSLQIQDYLIRAFQTKDWQALAGISAMPSLHVAQGCLTALFVNRSRFRSLRVCGWLYLLGLVLGSVILGWHYAIDGLVAIAGVSLAWKVSGWVAERELIATMAGSLRSSHQVRFLGSVAGAVQAD
jgi:hypothetical protein